MPKSGRHKFCSEACKGKWQYISGKASTENQYKSISGDWHRYLARLQYAGGRKRDLLTVDILVKILEKQNYLCALSGLPMTCQLEVGKKFNNNASVDRILAGKDYKEENVQLVCQALNRWRSDASLEDFIAFCKAVASYQSQLEIGVKDGRT